MQDFSLTGRVRWVEFDLLHTIWFDFYVQKIQNVNSIVIIIIIIIMSINVIINIIQLSFCLNFSSLTST